MSYAKKSDEDSWSVWFFMVTQKYELRASFKSTLYLNGPFIIFKYLLRQDRKITEKQSHY